MTSQRDRTRPAHAGPLVLAAVVSLGAMAGCTGETDRPPVATVRNGGAGGDSGSEADRARESAFARFTDATGAWELDFRREHGFDGENWRIVETVNGGLAFLDFDGDGLIDVYFTNGRRLDPGPSPARNALFRNAGGRFEAVSEDSGADDPSLSLGVAVADLDGNGRPDLYVTNDGPNRLFLNRGDGRFEDVAEHAGVGLASMDSGCAFLDMDADGDLDLYVASYVRDEKAEHPPLVLRGVAGYWPPLNYPPAPDHLFENTGDGRFTDVSERSGIRKPDPGRGLGVIAGDFNRDGHADVFVANDMSANFMFLGDGAGGFEESAFYNGTAYGERGDALGSMGVDAADYDADGLPDLVVTNYVSQPNNLFRAAARGEFVEMAWVARVAENSLPEVAWGAVFADLDLDGLVDLFIANGHLNPRTEEMDASTSYEQANRLFRNLGNGRFEDRSSKAGDAITVRQVSRGAAAADIEGDGDLDLVVLNAFGPPQLLRNDLPGGRAWSLVLLAGEGLNRNAIGARVTLVAGGRTQERERRSSTSYLSAGDPRLHFGLGAAERIERLEVRWPDGSVETHEDLPVRRLLVVRKGAQEVEARSP